MNSVLSAVQKGATTAVKSQVAKMVVSMIVGAIVQQKTADMYQKCVIGTPTTEVVVVN